MVLGLIVAMFRYPLQLLGDFLALGLIVGMIALYAVTAARWI